MANSKRDYEIGYGKPPKATQFQKGTSGNASGRPKGAKNLKAVVNDALNTKVGITEGGEKRELTKIEVIMLRLTNDALRGDSRAIKMIFELAREYQSPEVVQGKESLHVTSDMTPKEAAAAYAAVLRETE